MTFRNQVVWSHRNHKNAMSLSSTNKCPRLKTSVTNTNKVKEKSLLGYGISFQKTIEIFYISWPTFSE